MKNALKLFGIIALAAIIGFSFTACGGDGGGVNATLKIVNNYTASITKVEVTNYGGIDIEDTTEIPYTAGSNSKTLTISMGKPEDSGWWGVTLYATGLVSYGSSKSIWIENGKTTTVTLNTDGTITVENPSGIE
ncbi:MAG: hypothetical protein LBG94_01750 [Treponema sp.]|jgi:hypothetical protein|nr:hypothetical protein [Treponema sp.]